MSKDTLVASGIIYLASTPVNIKFYYSNGRMTWHCSPVEYYTYTGTTLTGLIEHCSNILLMLMYGNSSYSEELLNYLSEMLTPYNGSIWVSSTLYNKAHSM